jgi:hypothetical protein
MRAAGLPRCSAFGLKSRIAVQERALETVVPAKLGASLGESQVPATMAARALLFG